jgi:type II secretory pathway pseudopilin PulG
VSEHAPDTRRPDESGLSLVEVVVAMVMLGIVALAFLPLVARTASAAATGTTVVTATRLVSEQMDAARASAGTATCPPDKNDTVVKTVTDPRQVQLQIRTDVVVIKGSCAAGATGLVRFDASVTRATDPGVDIASASTLISVGGP